MKKMQVIAAMVGMMGLVGAVSACGSDDDKSTASATGGSASVTVDGQAQDFDAKAVVCTEQAGKFQIAIGDASGSGGVGAVLTTGDSPEVESAALGSVNGQLVSYAKGVPGAEAKATKDGKTYTITGTAMAVDTANPTAPGKKSFEIKVTCP